MWHKIINRFRSVRKNSSILTVNIFGLSIGLATTILLIVYIMHESGYDRHFANSENIYRLHTIWTEEGITNIEPIDIRAAYTDIPSDVAGIKSAVQFYRGSYVELNRADTRFTGNNLLYVDSTFFEIFDFKCIEGSLGHALDDPNSIVLTKTLANKIFGEESAIGNMLVMNNKNYTVTAVTSDVPANTHYYSGEDRLEQLVRLGAALAIIIVMMGIFMLISQTIAGRTKEIGIRKVMGGSTRGIISLLYHDSLKWTAIASMIAIPVSYLALQKWLQNFAVKAPVKWWLFALGIVIVLVLETLITLGHTWRAATRNPAEALKYE